MENFPNAFASLLLSNYTYGVGFPAPEAGYFYLFIFFWNVVNLYESAK